MYVCHTRRSGYTPWILKWVGLESSGQRLISSIGKTKRIAFCLGKKKYLKKIRFVKEKIIFVIFLDFDVFF